MNNTARKISSLAVLGLAVTSIGCGKSVDEVRSDVDRTVQEFSVNDNWVGACTNASLDWLGVASKVEEYDLGANAAKRTTIYQEDACEVPSIEVNETGSYTLGAKVGEVYPLDISYTEVNVKPLDDAGRDLLNSVSACGVNDWRTGEARVVTQATSDNPVADRCWAKTPRQLFDVVKIENDQLFMGLVENELDKTAAEKRPTRVDPAVPFARK